MARQPRPEFDAIAKTLSEMYGQTDVTYATADVVGPLISEDWRLTCAYSSRYHCRIARATISVPNAVRIDRYSIPVAAITAE